MMSQKSFKRLKVASGKSTDVSNKPTINWEMCCLCQIDNGEILKRPFLNKNIEQRRKSYENMAKYIQEFYKIGKLPKNVILSNLDEGSGIQETLILRQAKWHKSCSLCLNSSKLVRAQESEASTLKRNRPTCSTGLNEDEDVHYITRSAVPPINTFNNICCLCRKGDLWNEKLHQVMADSMEERLRSLATAETLAAIGSGNFIAQEVKYHQTCLNNQLKIARRSALLSSNRKEETRSTNMCESMAFADLATYIKTKLLDSNDYIFKMSILTKLYKNRLSELLRDKCDAVEVHSTRLRERIEACFPELTSAKVGKEYQLFKEETNFVRYADEEDADNDAIVCKRFIRRLRQELSTAHSSFTGTFERDCQEKSVPPILLAVVNDLLYGQSMVENAVNITQPVLTISQLILFNYRRNRSTSDAAHLRNQREREPPLPLYLALSIHGRSRDKSLIDELHKLGISVSSNRVQEVTSSLCQLVVNRANEEGILCPCNLRKNLFTVGAYDNIDHNPSSTTSKSSFHGTSISIFQMTTSGNFGENRILRTSFADVNHHLRTVPELPDDFAVVKTTVLQNNQPSITPCDVETYTKMVSVKENTHKTSLYNEEEWLQNCKELFFDEPTVEEGYSWAAFYATKHTEDIHTSLNALLPLFTEDSASVSMLRHGFDLLRNITDLLNPGQIPVMWIDQPLFALAKLLQWNSPSLYGEDKLVVMFGPFHIEQAFERIIGQMMDSCGWIEVLESSGIYSYHINLSAPDLGFQDAGPQSFERP